MTHEKILIVGKSLDLTEKSSYRIMVLGATATGKTSIVRQFLYDQFTTKHVETMDDMYRGEFEASNGKTVSFDIEDVGANYIYEFPSMKTVSLASADAFILVFSLDQADTWDEVYKLRDMVREAKVSFYFYHHIDNGKCHSNFPLHI